MAELDRNPIEEQFVSSPLKRKRPPMIEINDAEELRTQQHDAVCFTGIGVAVSAVKGKKKFMEDSHKIVSCLHGNSKEGSYGVYDGHGGKKAVEFVAENLHTNILEKSEL